MSITKLYGTLVNKNENTAVSPPRSCCGSSQAEQVHVNLVMSLSGYSVEEENGRMGMSSGGSNALGTVQFSLDSRWLLDGLRAGDQLVLTVEREVPPGVELKSCEE